jgi:hypothetical protein
MKPINMAISFFVGLAFIMAVIKSHKDNQADMQTKTEMTANGRALSADSSGREPMNAEAFAEKAAAYWIKKVGPQLEALNTKHVPWRGEDDDTKSRLQAMDLNSPGDFCYYLFSVVPRPHAPPEVKFDNNTRVCRNSPVDHFWLRAYVIAGVIETVLAPHAAEFTAPFQVRGAPH